MTKVLVLIDPKNRVSVLSDEGDLEITVIKVPISAALYGGKLRRMTRPKEEPNWTEKFPHVLRYDGGACRNLTPDNHFWATRGDLGDQTPDADDAAIEEMALHIMEAERCKTTDGHTR